MARLGPLGILRNRNYFVYFAGQLVSMSGSWMQSVAQAWLVYRLSQSGYWLGVITFAGQLPAFLLAPFAGVLADHYDRRKILALAEALAMFQAFILGALVFSGLVQVWHVVLLAVVLGLVNAFEMTARHAFAVDMVGKAELSSAIALNSVLINIARVIGPTIAGVTLAAVGEAWCFTLNGISYIPVFWGLLTMKLQPVMRHPATKSMLGDIVDGLRYARRSPMIFRILILSTFVCLVACPFAVLLPVFAKQVLGGGASMLAVLSVTMGFGAVIAALLFSGEKDPQLVKRKLIADIIFWGFGLITLGTSKEVWLSLCAMFMIGYFMMSVFPAMNNAIQQVVDDSMRGRMVSFYTMTFLGTVPVGSFVMGWLSDRIGAPHVVTGAGALTLALGLALVVRNAVKHRIRELSEELTARPGS